MVQAHELPGGGRILATGGADGTLKVWDLDNQYYTHNFRLTFTHRREYFLHILIDLFVRYTVRYFEPFFSLNILNLKIFVVFCRVRRPLLCLCRPFCIFERCDSNPESYRSKQARYHLSHLSL